MKKVFGTDGVRGIANQYPITAEFALRLGIAVGNLSKKTTQTKRVLIGKDTRQSGYMLETALAAGFTSVGMDVYLLGPVSTPAIGILTKAMRADIGVMISASHNSFEDNGIKLFGPDGFKLSDDVELQIEEIISKEPDLVGSAEIGRVRRINDGLGRYVEFVKSTVSSKMRLDGFKVVIDCANGATYKSAPQVFWELGANVVTVGVSPNGRNINLGCGSMHTDLAAKKVLETGADLGVCLDGDGDRVSLIDEKGKVVSGDQLIAVLARDWFKTGRLSKKMVVSTVMANMGLERYLGDLGIELIRTPVGDRYVVEKMREHGCNLGGEQSGHILVTDFATTGDGLIAGLQICSALANSQVKASEFLNVFQPTPQKTINVTFDVNVDPLKSDTIVKEIDKVQKEISKNGRLLVRKSGTEPVLRIMGESEDRILLDKLLKQVATVIEKNK